MASDRKLLNRELRAAAILLLCVVLSGSLLFSHFAGYTVPDTCHYIPLTQSNGTTRIITENQDAVSGTAGAFYADGRMMLTASPVLTANWFRVTDENTVWKGDTQIEIFRVSYENGENQITVKSGNGDKVIAPGTENSYTFALENTSSGPVEYSMSMKAYFSSDAYTIPVVAKVTRDVEGRYLLGGESGYEPVLELSRVEDSGTLKKGYVMPYTLSWQWPFEGDDTYDTLLGNLAQDEDLTLTIVIETYATYTPDASDGIPQTGDLSQIGVWFTVMLGSAAALLLMFLLPWMRRRGEDDEEA